MTQTTAPRDRTSELSCTLCGAHPLDVNPATAATIPATDLCSGCLSRDLAQSVEYVTAELVGMKRILDDVAEHLDADLIAQIEALTKGAR